MWTSAAARKLPCLPKAGGQQLGFGNLHHRHPGRGSTAALHLVARNHRPGMNRGSSPASAIPVMTLRIRWGLEPCVTKVYSAERMVVGEPAV